jgi:hypothetical protein
MGLVLAFVISTLVPATIATAQDQTKTVTVPAGTPLMVTLETDVAATDKEGKKFAATLETDLKVGDTLVAPAGTKVYGVVDKAESRRVVGRSSVALKLTQINIGGSTQTIVSDSYKEAGDRNVKKAARGAAGGAAIGAVAGDAGKGAAVGATVGAARKGEKVGLSKGDILEFQLSQPANIMLKP